VTMMPRNLHAEITSLPSSCPRVGILDWGIGGLGFSRLLLARRPGVAITYFSDSGEVPYGRLSKKQLVSRLGLIMRFFHQRGVTHLVVACNAMSTILPPAGGAGPKPSLKIVGVIEPTISAVLAMPYRRYGIVGGRRTILSGAYRTRLGQAGRIVSQRIAQPISRLIEDGKADSGELAAALEKIVKPLGNAEALILGCTHYSAVLHRFTGLLPACAIIDPADLTLAWIEKNWDLPASKQSDVYFTTGSVPSMRKAARKAFGVELGTIHKLSVDLAQYR
jgi:glutamate racemase